MWLYLYGSGFVGVFIEVGVFDLGAFLHALENLT